MLRAAQIEQLLRALNTELAARDVRGEIVLCGGAVMCLVFKARAATKDVDAIFAPTQVIREAARKIGRRHNLPADWLNDAAKGFFLSDPPKIRILECSHLRVWAPTAEYLLAMKCIAARFDTHDREDVIFLIRHLRLATAPAVFRIIEQFYPRTQVPPKTAFLVEELFERSPGS